MKTPGRAKTVLSTVVFPAPSAPPSKACAACNSQTERFAPFTEPGKAAFRLVNAVQAEPVEVDPLWAQITGTSNVRFWTVPASAPPPGAVAFQWSVRRNVNED